MMTPGTRTRYFAMWATACEEKGWNKNDQHKRREVALHCMLLVRGPAVTTSDDSWGEDETTALFTYLDHLAHPSCLERSQRWVDCQQDYRAFNRARQADWHQGKAYGKGKVNRLDRDRFNGATSAQGDPQDVFNPAAIQKRFLTTRTRHVKRKGYQRPVREAPEKGQELAGTNLASQATRTGVVGEVPF